MQIRPWKVNYNQVYPSVNKAYVNSFGAKAKVMWIVIAQFYFILLFDYVNGIKRP